MVSGIVSAMGDSLDDGELQGLACWTLGNLACNSENNSAAIARAGGVQHIIAASKEHFHDAAVQTAAFWALWNLSLNSALGRSTILSTRGVDQILSAMKQHLEELHVQVQACGLLWSLAVDEDPRQAMTEAGAVDAIVEALVAHPESEPLRVQACGILGDLSSASGLDKAINSAFRNSKHHAAAIEKTKGLVGAPWNVDIAFSHKEWLQTLADAPVALVSHCTELWNHTSDKKLDNGAARLWTGSVSRLVAAMDRRPLNSTVQLVRRLEH